MRLTKGHKHKGVLNNPCLKSREVFLSPILLADDEESPTWGGLGWPGQWFWGVRVQSVKLHDAPGLCTGHQRRFWISVNTLCCGRDCVLCDWVFPLTSLMFLHFCCFLNSFSSRTNPILKHLLFFPLLCYLVMQFPSSPHPRPFLDVMGGEGISQLPDLLHFPFDCERRVSKGDH